MKNKKLIYVLLPLVILIWGIIFYMIFFSATGEDELPDEIINPKKAVSAHANTDTFSIIADYRDPFLNNMVSAAPAEPAPNENKKTNTSSLPKPNNSTVWPVIIYGGMIKNQQSAKQLALLKINGKENIIKSGEMVGEIELVKIYKDSIEVKMGKERKVVRK